MTPGFFACPPDAWELAAEHIPHPWPAEAAIADLRWWQDRQRMGREDALPGRPTLRARWGWTDHKVRKLLKNRELWADDFRQRIASPSPANRQPANGSKPTITRKPPANRQPVASGSPASRARLETLARSQYTEHRSQSVLEGGASTTPAAAPAQTSPPDIRSESVQGEVEAAPSSKTWSTPATFWPVWVAAWQRAGWGTAPRRGEGKIPQLLQAWRAENISTDEATELVVLWLTDDDRWPRDGVPAIGHLSSVYRTYLLRLRRRQQRQADDDLDLDRLTLDDLGGPLWQQPSPRPDALEVF